MRLLLAALTAVGVHLVLFSLHMPWAQPVPKPPDQRAVTLSLVQLPAPSTAKPDIKPLPLPAGRPIRPLAAKKLPKPKPLPAQKPLQKSLPAKRPEPEPEAVDPAVVMQPDATAPEPQQTMTDVAATPSTDAVDTSPVQKTAPLTLSRPMYDTNPPLTYPSLARRRNYQGTVILDVLVSPRGRAMQVKVHTSSGHKILDRHAADSVRAWRFEPARRGTAAIEMWVQVPVKFELR